MDFYIAAIVVIVALFGARYMLRREQRRRFGTYKEVYRTDSREGSLPKPMLRRLKEEGVRYRIVFKRPRSGVFFGMSSNQPVALEVHVEDLDKANRIIAQTPSIRR